MKYILTFLLLQIHFLVTSQTTNIEYDKFKNTKFGIEFQYPKSWELGIPSPPDNYWVGLPKYNSLGNVVLKIYPWNSKVDIKNYKKEQYKKDILSTSIYYKDLDFIEFNNQIKISDVDGIYGYYKGTGKYVNSDYYEVLIQWWKNNLLYTLQGQFKEPSLTDKQILEFKKIIKSIKVY